MADSVNVLSLPNGFDLYGGYDDGNWPDAAAIADRFPDKTVVRFTVNPADNEGDCLDIESGDAVPTDAPGWTQRRRAAGHAGPLNYYSEASRSAVVQAYQAAGVAQPKAIVAAYPGQGAVLQQPGDAGHQWIDRGPYDESVVVDYLPGIDPAPGTLPGLLLGMPNDAFVRLMFRLLLCREVDQSGFATYVGALNSGAMSQNDVIASIQDSAEGQAVIAEQRKAWGIA